MGSQLGALKIAAAKTGLSLADYQRKIDSGWKWCWRCRRWHSPIEFTRDATRYDGLSASCLRSQTEYVRRRGIKKVRDPIKERARGLINARVGRGMMPTPDSLPCKDCGHFGDDRRHEYDHFAGYTGAAKEMVEAVCTICHARREVERKSDGSHN